MVTLHLFCLVAACIVFGLSAASLPAGRIYLVGLGLFLWSLSWFI